MKLVPDLRTAIEDLLGRSEEAEALFDRLTDDDSFFLELTEAVDAELTRRSIDPGQLASLTPTRLLRAEVRDVFDLTGFQINFGRESGDGLLRIDFDASYIASIVVTFPADDFDVVAATAGVDSYATGEDDSLATALIHCDIAASFEAAVDAPHERLVDVRAIEVYDVEPYAGS